MKIIIYLSLIVFINIGIASDDILRNDFSSLVYLKGNLKSSLNMDSVYGSHRKGIGIDNLTLLYTEVPILKSVLGYKFFQPEYFGISGRVGYKHYKEDFGIPGSTDIFESHVKFLYSVGKNNDLYSKYPSISAIGRHTFSIGYNGFLTTDTTSQVVGQIDYTYAKNNAAFIFNYMNDTIFVYPSDKYRTAAVKMSYYKEISGNLWGLSAGFLIWAGERKFDLISIWNNGDINIPSEVSRGETVTLYNGKEYATNIVFASISFNNLSLSVGYDSELFKKMIHNNIHYLIDDGNLPSIDREDRIFIEFKIGLPDKLF